jgi:hypothetical protein
LFLNKRVRASFENYFSMGAMNVIIYAYNFIIDKQFIYYITYIICMCEIWMDVDNLISCFIVNNHGVPGSDYNNNVKNE